MNALIKPEVAATTDHAAIESVELISVAIAVITPVAANSDWFEEWVHDLFEVPEHGNQPWEGETSGIEETWSKYKIYGCGWPGILGWPAPRSAIPFTGTRF